MIVKLPVLVRFVLVLLSLVSPPVFAQATTTWQNETPSQRDARMAWWREARFGLFIHWGLYSVPAGTWQGHRIPGVGEWIMHDARIPVSAYAKLAAQFNPVKFDAEAWVHLAKQAGMKYIVITAKHHDGFAMFKSAASSYNVFDATPFKRDPLKELAAACRKYGLRLGFYYSEAQDWHHAGGAASGGHWDPAAQDGDMTTYIRTIAVPQIRELLTNYGPVAVLWWDTPIDMNRERADLLAPLLKLQPGIITNNRLGGGYGGDTETPEQRIPATGYQGDWESCMTMNDTWGFKSYDENWKSAQALIRNLIDISSKGGNYLLNVGPTAEGEIPAASAERLRQIGAWLRTNGESIYGTTSSPFRNLEWGRATQKPYLPARGESGTLYLHVFNWPADGVLRVPMRSGAKKAYLLGKPEHTLKFTSSSEGLRVDLPAAAPDAISSVVVLEGVGHVDALPPSPIRADEAGVFSLACDAADLFGRDLRVEGNLELNLTGWRATDAYPQWTIQVDRPGTRDVSLVFAVSAGMGGSEFTVNVGPKQSCAGRTVETGARFREVKVGSLIIEQTGRQVVTIKPAKIVKGELMKLRTLVLRPSVP